MNLTNPKQWNDEKWDKLETYLVEFGHLQSNNEFLYNLQLEFLSRYISNDIEVVKAHMTELMEHKSIYSRDDFNWESNKTKLMNEVDNIILSFDLKPYHDLTKPPIKETKETKEAEPITYSKTRQIDIPQISNEPVNVNTAVPNATDPTLPLPKLNVIKNDMPKLSAKQRITSLELMNSNVRTHKRTNSLRQPVVASTSNVNVLTKPEIKGPGKKFDFTSIINRNKQSKLPTKLAVKGDKHQRRASLVGENLPTYIKDQLASTRTLNKKQSRMKNLVLNSESLYVHLKEPESIRSDSRGGSRAETTNTSMSHTESSNFANSDSEDDKEYILPNLLTRYYEEHEDEDLEFVDVNDTFNGSKYSYESSGDEVPNDDDEEEDDDDLLFR